MNIDGVDVKVEWTKLSADDQAALKKNGMVQLEQVFQQMMLKKLHLLWKRL